MKYMLLIYHAEQAWDGLTQAERQKIYAEYGKFTQEIMASGHHLGGFELHPISTATSVRVRDGEQLATDGPFAETKEQLGGYFLGLTESYTTKWLGGQYKDVVAFVMLVAVLIFRPWGLLGKREDRRA